MDLLNQAVRQSIIEEINSDENKLRKAEHVKRYDVYNDRQRKYVLKQLEQEFSKDTVKNMRTCTSINLTKRIVNEQASIYRKAPERTFENATEQELKLIDELYEESKADVKLKWANKKYKLHEQSCVYVGPKAGRLIIRCYSPHQYDVIPNPENPEEAYAYVISGMDLSIIKSEVEGLEDIQGSGYFDKNKRASDGYNQAIADNDDAESNKTYLFWTKEYQIKCDAKGNLIEAMPNPIQELPFIDVSGEKEFTFWIDRGSNSVEFNLDFSVVVSDTCSTNRLQGYAQPVISSEKEPQNLQVGPNTIVWLPLNPERPEMKPSFDFANPNPDLKASLDLQDRLLSYFLTSNGLDPKMISGSGEGMKFNSGYERLLSMIQKFEASEDDLDLFKAVEKKLFYLMKLWNNALQDTDFFIPELKGPKISDSVKLSVKYTKPSSVETDAEKRDYLGFRLDNNLMSKKEAIAFDRGISIEAAVEIEKEIDQDNTLSV